MSVEFPQWHLNVILKVFRNVTHHHNVWFFKKNIQKYKKSERESGIDIFIYYLDMYIYSKIFLEFVK